MIEGNTYYCPTSGQEKDSNALTDTKLCVNNHDPQRVNPNGFVSSITVREKLTSDQETEKSEQCAGFFCFIHSCRCGTPYKKQLNLNLKSIYEV